VILGVPYNFVKMIESSSNLKAVKLETNWPNMSVMISNQNPNKPWYDKRVRLAMAYAIDCDSIIKHVLFGIPNRVPWLAPGDLGYDPTVKTYPYDPKRAKELLAEAGYPNGFELKLYWPTNWTAMSQEVVQAIASYFEAVGIRTKLEGQEFETFSATRRAGKQPTSDYVAYANGGLAGASDPTLNADTHFACQGGASTHCNPEFDKVLAEARTTVDDTQRAELIKRLVKILREEVSYIPIFSGMATYGMKKNIDYVPTRFFLDLVLVKNITVK
jgi:peptide/nickel transport system substrate-binding protein